MNNEKSLVEGLVARDSINKNLKVDSCIVKWSGVERLVRRFMFRRFAVFPSH